MIQRKIINALKLVPLKTLVLTGFFALSLFLFSWIAHEAVSEQEDVFDARVHNFFVHHASPGVLRFMEGFTNLGSVNFLLPAYILLISYFIARKRVRQGIEIAVIALSSFLVMQGLKQVFQRQRPPLPIVKGVTSYSFPSGHSLSAFVFCSIVSYLIWKASLPRPWKFLLITLLFILAIMIGISRIILNVHYATDVIAGFCLGVMWVIASFWLVRRLR